MSVGVNKSGVVNAGSFVETNGAMLNTFMSEGYTPTASVENSCMERTITGFVVDKEYYERAFAHSPRRREIMLQAILECGRRALFIMAQIGLGITETRWHQKSAILLL